MIFATLYPIYVAFLLLSGLLLWFLIGARGKWWAKAVLIVVVPVFMFEVWTALGSFDGWSTSQTIPKKSFYVYGYSIEPDSNTHTAGAIYVWVIPAPKHEGIFEYTPKAGEPRGYVLPYSQQLEGQVQSANKAVAKGKAVELKKMPNRPIKGKRGNHSSHREKSQFKFYNFNPPQPPRKNTK